MQMLENKLGSAVGLLFDLCDLNGMPVEALPLNTIPLSIRDFPVLSCLAP